MKRRPGPSSSASPSPVAAPVWPSVVQLTWLVWAAFLLAQLGAHWRAWPVLASGFLAGMRRLPTFTGVVRAAAGHGAVLAMLALLLRGAWRLGTRALRPFALRSFSAMERHCIALAWGWALLASAAFGLALTGLYYPVALFALLGIALLVGRQEGMRVPALTPEGAAGLRMFAFAAAPFLLIGPFLLVPAQYVDALQYHLGTSAYFLKVHRFVVSSCDIGFNLQLSAELLNGYGIALGHDELGNWLTFIPWTAGIGLAALTLARTSGPVAAGLAAGIALTAHLTVRLPLIGKNDLACTGLVLVAMLTQARGSRLLAALTWGMAASVKMGGLAIAPVAWMWHEVARRRADRRPGAAPRPWRPDLAWLAAAGVFYVPWMVKAWILKGDPLWPVLSMRLPGALWDQAMQDTYRLTLTRTETPLAILAKLREILSVWEPAVALTLPLLVLVPAVAREGAALWLFSVAAFLWYAIVPYYEWERMTLPLYTLWAFPAAAAGARVAATLPADRRRLLLGLVTLASWSPVAWSMMTIPTDAGALRFLTGAATRDELRLEQLSTLEEARRQALSETGIRGVLFVEEWRTFGFPGRPRFDQWVNYKTVFRMVHASEDARRLSIRFRQMDVTHLLHNFVREGYILADIGPALARLVWTERDLALWHEFIKWRTVAIPPRHANHNMGGFYLFRLLPRPAARPSPIHYLPGMQQLLWTIREGALHLGRPQDSFALALARARQYPDVAQFQLEAGNMALHLADYKTAYALIRPTVDAGVIGDLTTLMCAQAASHLGNLDDSIALLRLVVAQYPEIAEGMKLELARSLAFAGTTPPAPGTTRAASPVELCREAVALAPDNAGILNALGVAMMRSGRPAEAATVFREVMTRWPADAEIQRMAAGNLTLCEQAERRTP